MSLTPYKYSTRHSKFPPNLTPDHHKMSSRQEIQPTPEAKRQLSHEGLPPKKARAGVAKTSITTSPDQTKVIKHRRDKKFIPRYVLSNQQISSMLCPTLSIKDTYFPRMYIHTSTSNAIDGTWDGKRTSLGADANINTWMTLPLFPNKTLSNASGPLQSTKASLQLLTQASTRLNSVLSFNNATFDATVFTTEGIETPSNTAIPIRSVFTNYYNGGSFSLDMTNPASNPAIVTCWVCTPRRPMPHDASYFPLSLSTLDKYEQASATLNVGNGGFPNPTASDTISTTRYISDDTDKPTDWDFKFGANDSNLLYHWHVSKPKTFTLNGGDSLDYQVDFDPFKMDNSHFLNSHDRDFMPFCSKFLIIRVRGKPMPSRSATATTGTIATTLGGPTQLLFKCTEKHTITKMPQSHVYSHQTIVNNDLNDNNKDWQFYDIDPNDETIKVVDLLGGVDAT